MLDPNVLKRAVELAPGWSIQTSNISPVEFIVPPFLGDNTHGSLLGWRVETTPQGILDALAAELVRLVDAMGDYAVYEYNDLTEIVELIDASYGDGEHKVAMPTAKKPTQVRGPDRTENTINAIVEFYEGQDND